MFDLRRGLPVLLLFALPPVPLSAQQPLEPLVISAGFERSDLPLRAYKGGAMARLADGRVLLAVGSHDVTTPVGTASLIGLVSPDGGLTWTQQRTLVHSPGYNPGRPTLLRTRAGKLWLVHYVFVPGDMTAGTKAQSDLWITSSSDEGLTWESPRRLFTGYTAGQRGAIETSDGRLVISFSYGVDRGRNVSASLVSTDDGRTWTQSAALELGGSGAHSGALEPAVIERRDGRLWMLIRHQEHFWQSFSSDGGLIWGPLSETTISTPSPLGGSPASLIRLASGRIAMAWNPKTETPADASDWRKHGRGTLAVALSDDDGQTWTKPVVCAQAASVCYPHLLETSPGNLLLSSGLLKATDPMTGKRMSTDVVVIRFSEATVLRKAGN
jgi:hypothetical protein